MALDCCRYIGTYRYEIKIMIAIIIENKMRYLIFHEGALGFEPRTC